jgi:hypothetical protein
MANNKNIFSDFPSPEELIKWFDKSQKKEIPAVNGHIHTPHSFSAFKDIEQAFKMAEKEGVSVLGINDFYTTGGYEEFAGEALRYKVFPLFNIEFMVLQEDLQQQGVLVNDPNNPGRTYFSGKGLSYPVKMSEQSLAKVKELQKQSNQQTFRMVEKLNGFLSEKNIDLQFDAAGLKDKLAKNLFRERHIAQAIRLAVFEKEESGAGRKELLRNIFSGKELKSDLNDAAGLENEIRSNLLKSGGAAFVPEDKKAFLSLTEVMDIITDAGGIPCYPVLLDDPKGNFTDYESDKEKLLEELTGKDVYAIELIPGRNDFSILKDFVTLFHSEGFIITFGTEHNTPRLDPLLVKCRNGVPLDEELKQINYEGAGVIAAHQYLTSRGEEGYLKERKAKIAEKEKFSHLGHAVISWFKNQEYDF